MTILNVEARLTELGLSLPPTRQPMGNYVGAVQEGNLVFVAGHGPFRGAEQLFKGKLGQDIEVEQAYQAARVTILSALGSLKAAIGDLNRVRRIVRVYGMINCTPDFTRQPEVMDGASDLLVEIFGDRGRHARCAVGFVSLPAGMPVEIEMTVAIE